MRTAPDHGWGVAAIAAALVVVGCSDDRADVADAAADSASLDRDAAAAGKRPKIERIDLLLVLENAPGIDVEQCALQAELQRMLESFAHGQAGELRFDPIVDLHVAVVTSDLGDGGNAFSSELAESTQCSGVGDDGLLNHRGPRECLYEPGMYAGSVPPPETCCSAARHCADTYPALLEFADARAIEAAGSDLACVANPGMNGCIYKQPLEAALKALYPAADRALAFAGEPHGDGDNADFLRNDPVAPSLLVILLLGDEDDCSAAASGFFAFDAPDASELSGLSASARCALSQDSLHPIERYVDGLRALRPGLEELLFFAAITGVPQDLVDDSATSALDWGDTGQRAAFYDRLLADDRMRAVADGDAPRHLRAACEVEDYRSGQPAPRIARVARGFGAQAALRSVCETDPETGRIDYRRAIDFFVGRIAQRLAQLND